MAQQSIENIDEKITNNVDKFFSNAKTEVMPSITQIPAEENKKKIINEKRSASRPRTAYKKASQEYIGRDTKVESDLYFKVKDENDHLKKHQLQLNEYIKKINTNLEKVKHEVIIERKLADHKVVHVSGGYDVEAETLKMDNDKLQEKCKKMQTIIKGLQSQTEQIAGKSFGRKNLVAAKTSMDNQNDKNEYLKIINHLREQLKHSDNEVKRLSAEINTPNKQFKQITDYNKDLREKNSQISDVQMKYEKTQLQFETNMKILEHTKQSLEDYIAKYNEERKKNLDLENRIQLMESNLAKLPEYVSLIDEYKQKEKHLEDRIRDLCENPFIKQAEERGNVYRKMQESELSLNEATRRLKFLEDNNKTLEKESKILKEQYQIACIDRDKYKEEAMRSKISSEEREKHSKNFEEQFKLLGQYGEVDSNFTKILNILKLRDDNTSWMKIDFLDKMNEDDKKDPTHLNKEIERMKIEKGILGSELDKTKSLLQIQQQINEDQIKLSEEEKKILRAQNEKLMKKCEELAKLIDINKLPKQMRHADDLRRDLLSELLPLEKVVNMMSDNITEFSKDERETEYGTNENALDLYLGEAHFEEGLEKELGFKLVNIMSFVSVDFYLHETETSNLISGIRPMYNLQMSFKVIVDDHLINYFEGDQISIDIYYIKDNVQALLGSGKIGLSDLIIIETNTGMDSINNGHIPSRVINGLCQLFYARDRNLLIGSIHFKMRMRHPLLETVKWYRERNQLIREISPVHDVMMKKVEKELISMNNFSKGKVMSITILITKATGLKISGAPRRIMPYIYYQFYKFDEHFTETTSGNDPMFQDVIKYDVVYDNTFHDYIEKETINFFILDNSRPLELEMKNDEFNKAKSVNLVENPEFDDLIGICKVPLRGLLINDLIQNSFPIYNQKGQFSGELVLNIFWDQVNIEDNNPEKSNLPYETKAWEDNLVIKLADVLKQKGLNLNSAFEIFDRDNKQTISLVNFKDTILFTFKFTSNQQELEELTQVIFNNRTSLTKLDFYKIFSLHLPHEGPMEDLAINYQSLQMSRKKYEENKIVDNISINIGPKSPIVKNNEDAFKEKIYSKTSSLVSNTNNVNSSPRNKKSSNMQFVQPDSNSTQPVLNKQTTSKYSNLNLLPSSNRSIKEIVSKLNDYMRKTGKSTPLELFKMFDKDADLNIGKDELANGLAKLGIPISEVELLNMWKDITGNDIRIEKFGYQLFKKFYEKYYNDPKSSFITYNQYK